jgi:hypothetical protein
MTEVVSPTDTEIVSPIQTETPSPIQMETPAPTTTLVPTPLDAPQTTPTNRSILPATTQSPLPTSVPVVPVPTLVEPPLDLDVRGQVPFKWQYSRSLRASEAFQVLIWRDGTQEREGAAEFTVETEQQIDLDVILPERGGPGVYWWSVVVVDERTKKRISDQATPWRFRYHGAQASTRPPAATEPPQPPVPEVPTGMPTLPLPPSPTTPLG